VSHTILTLPWANPRFIATSPRVLSSPPTALTSLLDEVVDNAADDAVGAKLAYTVTQDTTTAAAVNSTSALFTAAITTVTDLTPTTPLLIKGLTQISNELITAPNQMD